jgi:parallel beta-helix repeat protein
MKTLDQVEPRKPINAANTPGDATSVFRITTSGSYYLTAPLTGVSGKNGITITASNVTVDLSGFPVTGVAGSLDGISIAFGSRNVSVRNGVLTAWGEEGVDGVDAPHGKFEQLQCSANGFDGLRLGPDSIVHSCQTYDNGVHGISVNGHGTFIGCVAMNNVQLGFIFDGGKAVDCVANGNGTNGFESEGAVFSHCSAADNGEDGFNDTTAGDRAGSYSACVADSNFGWGFEINARPMTMNGCTVNSNDAGGINAGAGSNITECTVTNSNGEGIQVGNGTTVAGCTASFNGLSGIWASTDYARVVGNTCDGNGWGVYVSGTGNRIESNNLTGNGTAGMEIVGIENLIVKNSAADNGTNYIIAADNKVGPIVSAPNSGAISGSTGGAGVGSTDPWANISF